MRQPLQKQLLWIWLVGLLPPNFLCQSATAGFVATQREQNSEAAKVADSEEKVWAFIGAQIIPVEGDVIQSGTLIVAGNRIQAVGDSKRTRVPDGAQVVDVQGKVIMPGLICTHSHVGGIGGADNSGAIQPDVRIYDSINVRDSGFRRAVAGGLTTLNIMPGSGHLANALRARA